VVLACVSTALLWGFTRWRPRFHFSLASLRGLVGFSLNVFGTRLLFYGNRNADNLLIGRFVGAAGLGVYGLAYNVMLAPMSRLGWPIAEVLFPAFSKMQDEPERMASAWVRVNRLVGSLTIPASLGLILVAPEFVTAVLGERWEEAIPIIRLLGWVSLLQSLGTLDSAVLLARNRSGTLLRYAVIAFVASVIAFVVGLEWGIVGVAAGYAIVSTFLEPYYAWLTARSLDVSVLVLPRALAGVAQASAAMACAVLAAKLFLLPADLAAGWSLVVLILVGIAVYVPLGAWRAPEVVEEVRDVVRSRRAAPAPRAEAQPTSS
jgi:O-antigen/teichoic acid export membrane protein